MNIAKVTTVKMQQNVEIVCRLANRKTYSYVFEARQARDGAKVMTAAIGPVVKTKRTIKPVTHVFEKDPEFGTGVVYPA
jgi:hypothetical protein